MSYDLDYGERRASTYQRLPARFLVGERFGRLTVISLAPMRYDSTGRSRSMALVKCDCGNEKTVTTKNLRSGKTQSCGCLHVEELKKRLTIHGMRDSRTYSIWRGMKNRCLSSASEAYKNYGGRGITICDAWMKFEGFFADMGNAPDGMQIDRINNEGNYEPENCRWATPAEQAVNTRSNHYITINGITKCSTEWAKDYGLNPRTVKRRITGLSWSPMQALTEPPTKTGLKKRRDSHV